MLLSDGKNSTGQLEPLDAAGQAAALGVPVYTIALGTPNGQVQVRNDAGQLVTVDVPPDTETLAAIAETTGARAFHAPTAEDLAQIYKKSRIEGRLHAAVAGGHPALRGGGPRIRARRCRARRPLVQPLPVRVDASDSAPRTGRGQPPEEGVRH